MILNLTYPVVLVGQPAKHRSEKRCLLVREVVAEVLELSGGDAPVAMTFDAKLSNGVTVLRNFNGTFYRSLRKSAADLARHASSVVFETRDPVIGELAREALRDCMAVRFDGKNISPDGIAMRNNAFLFEGDSLSRVYRLSRNFQISDADFDRASRVEERATQLLGRYLVIDGDVWVPTHELIYCATPPTGTRQGRVFATTSAAYNGSDYAGGLRHSMWSDPAARFFSAATPEAAAEFAGREIGSSPIIEVVDPSCVSSDIEVRELERCARLVMSEADTKLSIRITKELLAPLKDLVASVAAGKEGPDALADVLSDIANADRDTDGGLLKRITADQIDEFVGRYFSRPIEAADVPGFSYKS